MWKLFLTLLVSCGSGLRNSNRKVSLNDEPNQVLPTGTTNKVHQLERFRKDIYLKGYCKKLVCLRCYHLIYHSMNDTAVKLCLSYASQACCRPFTNKRLFWIDHDLLPWIRRRYLSLSRFGQPLFKKFLSIAQMTG